MKTTETKKHEKIFQILVLTFIVTMYFFFTYANNYENKIHRTEYAKKTCSFKELNNKEALEVYKFQHQQWNAAKAYQQKMLKMFAEAGETDKVKTYESNIRTLDNVITKLEGEIKRLENYGVRANDKYDISYEFLPKRFPSPKNL